MNRIKSGAWWGKQLAGMIFFLLAALFMDISAAKCLGIYLLLISFDISRDCEKWWEKEGQFE